MSESQHNSVVLKKSNQNRFTTLWGSFAKSEPNGKAMRLSEFMSFIIDRCLVTNKTTLKHFYRLFLMATEKRIGNEPQTPAVNNIILQKLIERGQFILLLNELGKYIYHNDKNQQDRVYNDLLGEKSHAEKDAMYYSRVMVMDETNRKMMFETAIKALTNFQDELKNIYVIYVEQNYWSIKKHNRILLNHREIELQNKKMSAVSFVRFLKQADILPHLINIEHVEEILSRVIPYSNPKENQFYYKHFLVDCYSKDLDNSEIKSEGDPGLVLFEFMIALARIAVETSKEVDNAKKSYDYIINKFFSSYLFIRNNDELEDNKQFPNIQKSYLTHLKKFYILQDKDDHEKVHQAEDQDKYNPFIILKEKQTKLDQLEPLQFNIPNMIKALNLELPPLPAEIQIKQEQPPPFEKKFKDVQKVTIGQQPPPEKADKNKNSQKPAPKKQQLKKGEKPPRVFQFEKIEEQTKKVESSEDYFQKLATQLDYSLKPLSSLERGSIPLDPFPLLITEILYPPEIPEAVLPFIEAGLNAHNDSAYALALQNYDKALVVWKDVGDITPNLELYFEFTKGGVYLSAGKDDYAFNCFYNCRNYIEKIAYLNPDRALPYCGLGEALYNAEEYELSAKCYLKARQIRQSLLGIQTVDTATVFNNIGCCFFMLDRPKEALSYFKVSREVMISELGEFHQRSQTTRQNVHLCNKSFYQNTPEFRKLWEVFEKDIFGKKKKKKKDAKKK